MTDIYNEVKLLKSSSIQAGPAGNEVSPAFFETLGLNFPLVDIEELNIFEEFLMNKENFEQAVGLMICF